MDILYSHGTMDAKDGDDSWVVEKELGRGSFGIVYLLSGTLNGAGDTAAVSKFALKLIEGCGTQEEEDEARRELRIMQGLYHPHVLLLLDSYHLHHQLFLLVELCEGGDLRTYLSSIKTKRKEDFKQKQKSDKDVKVARGLDEGQIILWSRQLTSGLQYLHGKRILHRDIKPQNIFLKDNLTLKIGDLGIARQLVYTREMVATLKGTPLYISPEIWQGQPYSYKTDVWSLGCCVYEMMTLDYAFFAPSQFELIVKVVNKKVGPLPDCYSPELHDTLLCMLNKDPDRRLSADEAFNKLQDLGTGSPLSPWDAKKGKADMAEQRFQSRHEREALRSWRLYIASALAKFKTRRHREHRVETKAGLDDQSNFPSATDTLRQSVQHIKKSATNSDTLCTEEDDDGLRMMFHLQAALASSNPTSNILPLNSYEYMLSSGSDIFENSRHSVSSASDDTRTNVEKSSLSSSLTVKPHAQRSSNGEIQNNDRDQREPSVKHKTNLPSVALKEGSSSAQRDPSRAAPLSPPYQRVTGLQTAADLSVLDLSPTLSQLQSIKDNPGEFPPRTVLSGNSGFGSALPAKTDAEYSSDVKWAKARFLPYSPPSNIVSGNLHGDEKGNPPQYFKDLLTPEGEDNPQRHKVGTGAARHNSRQAEPGGSSGIRDPPVPAAELPFRKKDKKESVKAQEAELPPSGDPSIQEVAQPHQPRRKKKNFLRERKTKSAVNGILGQQKTNVTHSQKEEESVRLFTRGQKVSFSNLRDRDDDDDDVNSAGIDIQSFR